MTREPSALIAACDCLDRSELALIEARQHEHVNWRYVYAHMAALRVAAAVLAVRATRKDTRGRQNAWHLVARLAPELHEWCDYFEATAATRALASASPTPVVSTRAADDLVRAVEQFSRAAEHSLGLTRAVAQ